MGCSSLYPIAAAPTPVTAAGGRHRPEATPVAPPPVPTFATSAERPAKPTPAAVPERASKRHKPVEPAFAAGDRVKVYWDGDLTCYFGRVLWSRGTSVRVRYDDDTEHSEPAKDVEFVEGCSASASASHGTAAAADAGASPPCNCRVPTVWPPTLTAVWPSQEARQLGMARRRRRRRRLHPRPPRPRACAPSAINSYSADARRGRTCGVTGRADARCPPPRRASRVHCATLTRVKHAHACRAPPRPPRLTRQRSRRRRRRTRKRR